MSQELKDWLRLLALASVVFIYLRWQSRGLKSAPISLYVKRFGPFVLWIVAAMSFFLSVATSDVRIFWLGVVLGAISLVLMIAFFRKRPRSKSD